MINYYFKGKNIDQMNSRAAHVATRADAFASAQPVLANLRAAVVKTALVSSNRRGSAGGWAA